MPTGHALLHNRSHAPCLTPSMLALALTLNLLPPPQGRTAGRADNALVSRLVKERLSGGGAK